MSAHPTHRLALAVLRRRLGAIAALRVAVTVRRRLARGAPFERLPPVADAAEQARRDEIAPIIVLFEVLRRRWSDARAIELCADVVEAAFAAFFAERFGDLSRARIAAMSDAERAAFVHRVERSLPHMVVHFERIDFDELRFTVAACRFVKLCHQVGCPELAPVFCAGDARYFARFDPAARLDRATTIASGGKCCPFVIRFE